METLTKGRNGGICIRTPGLETLTKGRNGGICIRTPAKALFFVNSHTFEGGVPKWCTAHDFFPYFYLILHDFMRDDCGPIENINKTSICLKIRKHLHFLGSAQHRMVDAQVGDRELQATTERSTCTRTTVISGQVDLNSLRAASTTWSTGT